MEEYKQACKLELNNLKKLIISTNYLKEVTNQMIKDIKSIKKNCVKDYPGENNKIPKNIDDFFDMIFEVITHAPEYNTKVNPFNGLPLLNLFIHLMVNKNGYLFFGDFIVNKYLTNHLHKDIHGGNFLWHNNNEKGYYEYVYNGKSFYVKACNYNIMIYDYSYATEITSKKEQISDYTEIIPTFLNESFSNSNSVSPPKETKDKLNSILDILMKKYTDTADYDVFLFIIENILIPFNIVETKIPKKIIKTFRL